MVVLHRTLAFLGSHCLRLKGENYFVSARCRLRSIWLMKSELLPVVSSYCPPINARFLHSQQTSKAMDVPKPSEHTSKGDATPPAEKKLSGAELKKLKQAEKAA